MLEMSKSYCGESERGRMWHNCGSVFGKWLPDNKQQSEPLQVKHWVSENANASGLHVNQVPRCSYAQRQPDMHGSKRVAPIRSRHVVSTATNRLLCLQSRRASHCSFANAPIIVVCFDSCVGTVLKDERTTYMYVHIARLYLGNKGAHYRDPLFTTVHVYPPNLVGRCDGRRTKRVKVSTEQCWRQKEYEGLDRDTAPIFFCQSQKALAPWSP